MKTVITLLKAASLEYEKGIVADGDKLLQSAVKLRTQMLKAQELAEEHSAKKTDFTTEKK